MPVISRFNGIVVFMNDNDHEPAHFHARYGPAEILVEIGSREVFGEFRHGRCASSSNGRIFIGRNYW